MSTKGCKVRQPQKHTPKQPRGWAKCYAQQARFTKGSLRSNTTQGDNQHESIVIHTMSLPARSSYMAQPANGALLVHVFGGEAHTDTSYKCFTFCTRTGIPYSSCCARGTPSWRANIQQKLMAHPSTSSAPQLADIVCSVLCQALESINCCVMRAAMHAQQ